MLPSQLREAAAKEAEGLQVELRTTQEALTAEKSLVAGMRDSVAKAEAEMTVARSELEAARVPTVVHPLRCTFHDGIVERMR